MKYRMKYRESNSRKISLFCLKLFFFFTIMISQVNGSRSGSSSRVATSHSSGGRMSTPSVSRMSTPSRSISSRSSMPAAGRSSFSSGGSSLASRSISTRSSRGAHSGISMPSRSSSIASHSSGRSSGRSMSSVSSRSMPRSSVQRGMSGSSYRSGRDQRSAGRTLSGAGSRSSSARTNSRSTLSSRSTQGRQGRVTNTSRSGSTSRSRQSSQRLTSSAARSSRRSKSTATHQKFSSAAPVAAGAAGVSSIAASKTLSGHVSSGLTHKGSHAVPQVYTRGLSVGVAVGSHGASFGVSIGCHTPAVYVDPLFYSDYWGHRYVFGGSSWRCWYYPLYGYWYHPSWHWWYYPTFGCWYYPDIAYWYYPTIGYSITYTPGARRYVLIENEQPSELFFGVYYQDEDGVYVRKALGIVNEEEKSKLYIPRRGEGKRMIVFARNKADLLDSLLEDRSDNLSKVVLENDDEEQLEEQSDIVINNLDVDDEAYLSKVQTSVTEKLQADSGELVDLRTQKRNMQSLLGELNAVDTESSSLRITEEDVE